MNEPADLIGWSDVLALVAQLDESGFEDADITTGGVRVRVSRHAVADSSATQISAQPAAPDESGVATSTAPLSAADASDSDAVVVKASILGVLYLRPSPESEPFVKVGDVVSPDTTVAVIEVMKMMNTINAGVSGQIVEICRPEGQMVEYGDVLFRLAPA